jgi:cathepsin A (carboxypeptidase C)
MGEYTPWLKHVTGPHVLGDALTDYVNREDVRTAMNIPSSVQAWEECSSNLNYNC